MKLKYFVIIILIALQVSELAAQQLSGLPFIKYYSSQDYEGGIQNWAVVQNNEGLIYVANNFGLLEFDGTNWARYTLPNGTKIRDVLVGHNGRIYVASQGEFGYFGPSQSGNFEFTSLADSLPAAYRNFDETWRIFEDDERLIFCTFKQVFIFNKGGGVQVIDPIYPPENCYFVNNTLFVSQPDVGLTYLDGDSLRLFDKGDKFKGKTITGLIPLANNHLWISTVDEGIFLYNGTDYVKWNESTDPAFVNASVNNALRLRSGNIAIGTQSNGLYITTPKGEILQHLNKDRGLNNRTVLSLYEDMLGNLWLGHNNGLTTVELNLPFSIISEQNGLPGTGYDGLLKTDKIYLGTNNGLYSKSLEHNTNERYEFVEDTEGQIYRIQNIENMLLLGHHKGTFSLEGSKTSQVSDILGSWTFLKLKNHPDYVLGGTYKGILLFKRNGDSLEFIRKIKGFTESSRVMEQDAEGNIWMTHGYKGVYKMQLNKALDSVSVHFYGQEEGLPSNILINVWRINNKLVFTTESGIYKYDSRQDKFIRDESYDPYFDKSSMISYLEQSPMGDIYYISSTDIGVLQKQPNGSYLKKNKIFNRLRGLLNDDLQNLSVLNANNVLYGAKEGFVLYTKNANDLVDIPYTALIREVSITAPKDSLISSGYFTEGNITSTKQTKRQVPSLPYVNNSLRIEFSAPYFHGNNNILYQYKLDNVDENWSEWTSKTDKEYTNLRPGTYTFTVRARNIYDQISEESSYSFIVLPPWYRSTTAYVVYVILAISIVLLIVYFVEIQHKKEKHLMAVKQEKEINRMDNQLRSSEERLQQLKNEKLESEVESKNKELATSTMHLLNKNSFINSVKHNISTIIKRSKNQEVKKELNKIMNNIAKNMAEDNDWEHFAIHFDQVHGDFTKRIQGNYPDLTPQEMKLSAYLRMNLSTKEIAHLLNISVRGVEIARYRLRKKLVLDRATNLQDFILKY